MSSSRNKVSWRLVASGIALQFFLAAIILWTTPGRYVFESMGMFINTILGFVEDGAGFVLSSPWSWKRCIVSFSLYRFLCWNVANCSRWLIADLNLQFAMYVALARQMSVSQMNGCSSVLLDKSERLDLSDHQRPIVQEKPTANAWIKVRLFDRNQGLGAIQKISHLKDRRDMYIRDCSYNGVRSTNSNSSGVPRGCSATPITDTPVVLGLQKSLSAAGMRYP